MLVMSLLTSQAIYHCHKSAMTPTIIHLKIDLIPEKNTQTGEASVTVAYNTSSVVTVLTFTVQCCPIIWGLFVCEASHLRAAGPVVFVGLLSPW